MNLNIVESKVKGGLDLTQQEARLVRAFRGVNCEDMSFILRYVERMAWKRCGERSIAAKNSPSLTLVSGGRAA